jgi:sorbitol/mannitol transport system permease protein
MSQLNPPITDHHLEESAAERDKRRAKSVRWLISPLTGLLFLWMAIPLAMMIWFSFSRYNLLNPDAKGFAGLDNYEFLATDPAFGPSIAHTRTLITSVLVITVVGGVLLAVLFDRKFLGQGIARLLVIAPFLSCRRYPRSSGRT